MTPGFWSGRRVFVTGHTGFKGAWLCLWLAQLGAQVRGYALAPPTDPSLFALADAGAGIDTVTADVRDLPRLSAAVAEFAPEVVLHMAAQSVVLSSYQDPVQTFSTNVLGTVHLLEAVRRAGRPMAVVNVTTDKVYRNHERARPYREDDALGGHDPYSASKACAELVGQSFAASFFGAEQGVALASARAGNVIGGGDWTPHQLVPAVIAAMLAGQPAVLRHPAAVRPWQHVLDCLGGYLTLAEALVRSPQTAAGDWNFGPPADEIVTVAEVAQTLAAHWQQHPGWVAADGVHPHEAQQLRLDAGKAAQHLGWRCRWTTTEALAAVAQWHRQVQGGSPPRSVCAAQIEAFMAAGPTGAGT